MAAKRLCVYLLVASSVLVAFCVAGCGSSDSKTQRLSPSEYSQKLMEISERYSPNASRLFTDLVLFAPASGTPDLVGPACADSARKFAGILHDIVDSVAALTPPKDVEELQSRFLKEAQVSVAVVDEAARDVEAGRLSCGRDMNARIYGLPSTDQAEAVLNELSEKGYLPAGD